MIVDVFSQSSPKARAALGGVVAATIGALLLPATGWAQKPREMPPAPVVVEEVVEEQLNLGESFVGTVMPVRRSTVGSQGEGLVEEFFVNEGDRVAADQPLARLRTTTIDLELKAAEAELALREAELAELEASAPKEIEQAKLRMESAEAQVVFNDKRLERFQDLFEKRVLSDDELEEQVYAAEAARKTYLEAKSAWELASGGIWDAKIAQSKARVRVQEETIAKLRDDLQQHTIAAPFEGYITREHVEAGQWVAQGGPVVEMVEIDRVDVEMHVLERYAPKVRVGAPARVEIEALPGQIRNGEVVLVVPQADERSRSFPVKVRLENEPSADDSEHPGMKIKPGMFARATLPVGRSGAARMVHKDAVVLGADSSVVWVIAEDWSGKGPATAAPVPVELGVSYDERIEVRGPLEPGQWVVVEGNERIRPDQKLTITRRAPSAADSSPASKAASAGPSARPAAAQAPAPAPAK